MSKEIVPVKSDSGIHDATRRILKALKKSKSTIIDSDEPFFRLFVFEHKIFMPFFTLNKWGILRQTEEYCHDHFKEAYAEYFFAYFIIHRELEENGVEPIRTIGNPRIFSRNREKAFRVASHSNWIDGNIFTENVLRKGRSEEVTQATLTMHTYQDMVMAFSLGEFDEDEDMISQKNLYPLVPGVVDGLVDRIVKKNKNIKLIKPDDIIACTEHRSLIAIPYEEDIELSGNLEERRDQYADFLRDRLIKKDHLVDKDMLEAMETGDILDSYRFCVDCGNEIYSKQDENHALLESISALSAFDMMGDMSDHDDDHDNEEFV